MKTPRLSTLALTAALLLPLAASPRRQRTTRRPLDNAATTPATLLDTIAIAPTAVKLAGYDKPMNARAETVFATNTTADDITAMRLTLRYTDLSGRQLHRRSLWIRTDIPAGETRLLSWPTWDRQQSFYYRLSRKPRAQSTPYDVEARVDSLIVVR
jgi:hypothetical protein